MVGVPAILKVHKVTHLRCLEYVRLSCFFFEAERLKVSEVYTTSLTEYVQKCLGVSKEAKITNLQYLFLRMTGWIVMIYDLVKLRLSLDFVVTYA